MLKMVDGTGIIGVDMICPLGVSTPQPPNYDRVEMDGTGMLVLPNSLDAPLERLELGGKTAGKKEVIQAGEFEQGTITAHAGTNFDSNYRVRTKNYINLTSGTYEVTCTGAKLGNVVFYSVENKFKKMLSRTHIPLPIKFTLTENKLVRVLFSNSESTPITPADIKNAILEADASPEHPQDIVNSGKWNEETRKYEVDIEISGNFFDVTKVKTKTNLINNGDGSLHVINKNVIESELFGKLCPDLKVGETCVMRLESTGLSYISINGMVWGTGQAKTITQNILDSTVYFYGKDGSTVVIKNIRITRNTGKNMEYTPYRKPQHLTLTSDRPITKWDKLVEQGGEIGWLYSTGVYEDIKESDISANSINDQYGRYYVNAIKAYKNAECMCNIAEYSPAQKENKCGFWWSDTLCFLISSEYTGNNGTEDNSTAIKNFKDNVLSKGIAVFYKLNTEEFIPLQQSEQNAIRALKTYYPTTVITVDGGEVDPDIKVTYRKEI